MNKTHQDFCATLWYTKHISTQPSSHTCSQCGSPLVLVKQVTEEVAGSLFPQTTSTYHCTNKTCQDEKDKQAAQRIKQKEEKELADQQRAERKLKK